MVLPNAITGRDSFPLGNQRSHRHIDATLLTMSLWSSTLSIVLGQLHKNSNSCTPIIIVYICFEFTYNSIHIHMCFVVSTKTQDVVFLDFSWDQHPMMASNWIWAVIVNKTYLPIPFPSSPSMSTCRLQVIIMLPTSPRQSNLAHSIWALLKHVPTSSHQRAPCPWLGFATCVC